MLNGIGPMVLACSGLLFICCFSCVLSLLGFVVSRCSVCSCQKNKKKMKVQIFPKKCLWSSVFSFGHFQRWLLVHFSLSHLISFIFHFFFSFSSILSFVFLVTKHKINKLISKNYSSSCPKSLKTTPKNSIVLCINTRKHYPPRSALIFSMAATPSLNLVFFHWFKDPSESIPDDTQQ